MKNGDGAGGARSSTAAKATERERGPTWEGARPAFIAIFAPFVLTLLLSFGFRVWAVLGAADALDASRESIEREIRLPGAAELSDEDLAKRIDGDLKDDTDNRVRLVHILRQWVEACERRSDPTQVRHASELECAPANRSAAALLCHAMHCSPSRAQVIADRLFSGAVFADILVQTLLVLIFPGLFYAALGRAVRLRKLDGTHGVDALGVHLLPYPARDYLTADRLEYLRVEERDRPHFFVRLGFALLITLGVQYILAPAGMQASAMGEFATLVPEPGSTTLPFFASYLPKAPPYVIGFAGFYVYGLAAFLGRFSTGTLNHLIFLQMFRRGLTSLLLSLVLTGVWQGALANAMAFTVGFFPEAGFRYLEKVAQGVGGKIVTDSPEVQGFRPLPELDVWKQSALAEIGVTSLHDLAHTPWQSAIRMTGIDPLLLLHAADRALLIDLLGYDAAMKLRGVSIRTATGLDKYLSEDADGKRAALVREVLAVTDVEPLMELLAGNANVRFLRVSLPAMAAEYAHPTVAEPKSGPDLPPG